MIAQNTNKLKYVQTTLKLCLFINLTGASMVLPAAAHGTSSGSESGGLALLIFPIAAIFFVLFLVFAHRKKGWTILVTGGAGYVGSALVPKLLLHGHRVVVLDLFPNGKNMFEPFEEHENLRLISGDFTDQATLTTALRDCDAVIHLACVTGRGEQELGSALVRSTNLTAFQPLVEAAKFAGVKRFVFASSLRGKYLDDLHPPVSRLTLDENYEFLIHKERCEHMLEEARTSGFVVCTVRVATVFGAAPSQRLDFGINAIAWQGFNEGEIHITDTWHQTIPNIHVEDLAEFFINVLNQPDARIDGKLCEANSENLTRSEMAKAVAAGFGDGVRLKIDPGIEVSDSEPSYDEIIQEFGFEAKHTVAPAVYELLASFQDGVFATAQKK